MSIFDRPGKNSQTEKDKKVSILANLWRATDSLIEAVKYLLGIGMSFFNRMF